MAASNDGIGFLAQRVGCVSLKALCDSSLIGRLHLLNAVKCY